MSEKRISMTTYQWSHFAVIMVEIIVFFTIGYLALRSRSMLIETSKNIARRSKLHRNLTIIFWISAIFIVITFLSLIPVFMEYSKIVIN